MYKIFKQLKRKTIGLVEYQSVFILLKLYFFFLNFLTRTYVMRAGDPDLRSIDFTGNIRYQTILVCVRSK